MSFWSWLQGKMLGGKIVEVSSKTIESFVNEEKLSMLTMEEFMIHAAINLIANCVSKCEFKTFRNGRSFQEEEHYLWNFEPNRNQNSSQFLQELVARLLYYNECLVIESRGQLVIAQSFTKEEFALKETIFSNVYRNGYVFPREYKISNVLYFQLSNKNIRQLLANLCHGYDDLLAEAMEKYERSTGQKGTLKIDSIAKGAQYGGKTFEEVYSDLMNDRFKKFFNSKNAVLPLYNGFTYQQQSNQQSRASTSEMNDITDVLDEAVETVARAFNVPVSLLKGDVSDVEQITRNFLTFCIDPICEMIQTEINRKRYGKNAILQKNYLKIDTTSVMHTDIFDIAEKIDKLIASGMYCIDELRRKLGDEELGTDDSQRHWITKNYESIGIDSAEGGEQDDGEDEIQI